MNLDPLSVAVGALVGAVAVLAMESFFAWLIDRFFAIEPVSDHTLPPPLEVGDQRREQ